MSSLYDFHFSLAKPTRSSQNSNPKKISLSFGSLLGMGLSLTVDNRISFSARKSCHNEATMFHSVHDCNVVHPSHGFRTRQTGSVMEISCVRCTKLFGFLSPFACCSLSFLMSSSEITSTKPYIDGGTTSLAAQVSDKSPFFSSSWAATASLNLLVKKSPSRHASLFPMDVVLWEKSICFC